MKKLLISFFCIFAFTFSVFADSIDVPSPLDFNNTLARTDSSVNYYYNYKLYYPKSLVVLKLKRNNSIYYYPTLSDKIFVSSKRIYLDGDFRFYAFNLDKKLGLISSGGISNGFDLDDYEILYLINGYTPNGRRMNHLGEIDNSSNAPDSWDSDSIQDGIDSHIPDISFDKDNENKNNSFFGSLAIFLKNMLESLKKFFTFVSKAFNVSISYLKKLFQELKNFFSFIIDFLNPKKFSDWFLKVIQFILFLDDGYLEKEFNLTKKLFEDKLYIKNLETLFTTLKHFEPIPFEDISLNFYVFGTSYNIVIIRSDFLLAASLYFRPIISWFLGFFIGLYHMDQLYLILRGRRFFSSTKGKDDN